MCFNYFYQKKLKPDYLVKDLRNYDWSQLKQKGIKIVFLDIDNTLALHGSFQPDDFAIEVVNNIISYDLNICVLSNAKSNRSKEYATHLNVAYMNNAMKPSPKRLLQKLRDVKLEPNQAILVGDQLFTDVWAGKNAKCFTMLVKQRYDQEAIQIRFKRKIERLFMKYYETRKFSD